MKKRPVAGYALINACFPSAIAVLRGLTFAFIVAAAAIAGGISYMLISQQESASVRMTR